MELDPDTRGCCSCVWTGNGLASRPQEWPGDVVTNFRSSPSWRTHRTGAVGSHGVVRLTRSESLLVGSHQGMGVDVARVRGPDSELPRTTQLPVSVPGPSC